MHLNLAESDPSRLLSVLQSALDAAPECLTLELLGPGILLHDTALMLHAAILARPSGTRIHAHSHTCLVDGAVLLWLAADTRSIRADAWIQLSEIPPAPACLSIPSKIRSNYSTAIFAEEENPADTDLRALIGHLGQWLPTSEIAGLRLFVEDLKELGLIEDAGSQAVLNALFSPPLEEADTGTTSPRVPASPEKGRGLLVDAQSSASRSACNSDTKKPK